MKRCYRCKKEKGSAKFSVSKSTPGGLQSACKKCQREMVYERREKFRHWLDGYKLGAGCSVCGYQKCAAVLEFHHIGQDKDINIGKMGSHSRERVQREIAKCVLLCANCHRELHDADT